MRCVVLRVERHTANTAISAWWWVSPFETMFVQTMSGRRCTGAEDSKYPLSLLLILVQTQMGVDLAKFPLTVSFIHPKIVSLLTFTRLRMMANMTDYGLRGIDRSLAAARNGYLEAHTECGGIDSSTLPTLPT